MRVFEGDECRDERDIGGEGYRWRGRRESEGDNVNVGLTRVSFVCACVFVSPACVDNVGASERHAL